MAKKLIQLTARDIIMQADAETIREAFEARVKIDELLIQRDEAYRQIETIELQVEKLVGEEGAFIYPEPPVPVAGFSKPIPASRPKPKVTKLTTEPAPEIPAEPTPEAEPEPETEIQPEPTPEPESSEETPKQEEE